MHHACTPDGLSARRTQATTWIAAMLALAAMLAIAVIHPQAAMAADDDPAAAKEQAGADGKPASDGKAEPAAKPAEANGHAPLPTLFQLPETSIPAAIEKALVDRDYPAAIKAIDAALEKPGAASDYLGYLKGRALHLAGKYAEATVIFAAVERAFPKSLWQRRSKFHRAISLARQGNFRDAELIYREEATYLLSAVRKDEIAGLYLEFADAYFKPKDPNQSPDYDRALNFYREALGVGPADTRRMQIELRIAECFQAKADFAQAATLFAAFSTTYPQDPLDIEARFRLGECQFGQQQLFEARRTWQDLLAKYPTSKHERLAEALSRIGSTYGMPSPSDDAALNQGVAAHEAFLAKYPDHKLASLRAIEIARAQIYRGQFDAAAKSLVKFVADERYAKTEEMPVARVLLGQAYLMQKKFDQALSAWRDFLTKHPTHPEWSRVQSSIITADYLLGAEAFNTKQYGAARKVWQEFIVKYPLDPRCPGILVAFGQMSLREEKYETAIEEWRRVISRFPQSEAASQAQFFIALTLEEKLDKLEAALKEYRALTWGGFAQAASSHAARLTQKQLAIKTPRVFRSQQTPQVEITTRNIDAVSIKSYRVDLETYFRKMHLAGDVESLDIALIDPDQSVAYKVPKFEEYRQLVNNVDVALPAAAQAGNAADAAPAGVLAVTVASNTLEATTLVVQSDLDIIVKSSRDELFVFAENMRTGKPWPGVKLLISNGQQVFAEGTTGPDGVFQKSFDELHSAADVRVFAVAAGHVASSVINLENVSVAQGLADVGLIYSDKPGYRPGQLVHIRGVVRRAENDRFLIDAGKSFTLSVFDPRNRVVREEEIKLSDFGSFHAHFALPVSATPGGYRVQIADREHRTYSGGFLVENYQLAPVQLSITAPRNVYYRGEKIEGKIKLAYYYGTPLVGKTIRYEIVGSGRQFTAQTDKQGEIEFSLETQQYLESGTLVLTAFFDEQNLSRSETYELAAHGFDIELSTVRTEYLANEPFDLSLVTKDAAGEPIAEKLKVAVFEKTVVAGQSGERLVSEADATTDAKGQGRSTLRIEAGGDYVLRVSGVDRFGKTVSNTTHILISDDQDRQRLRIFADRLHYKAGEKAVVSLHWREEPALALVTYQGAKVLGYRLVPLAKGANRLEIEMTPELAPNFELSVAVMTDAAPPADPAAAAHFTRFHEAQTHFTVDRDLQLTLKSIRDPKAKGAIQPGEGVKIEVVATDSQGRPVVAEISLAMIDQALFDRYAGAARMSSYRIQPPPRVPAVKSGSSIVFQYAPSTKAIASALLAERERREIEGEEAARREAMLAQATGENGEWQVGYAGDGLADFGLAFAAPDGHRLIISQTEEIGLDGAVFTAGGMPIGSAGGMGGMGGSGAYAPWGRESGANASGLEVQLPSGPESEFSSFADGFMYTETFAMHDLRLAEQAFANGNLVDARTWNGRHVLWSDTNGGDQPRAPQGSNFVDFLSYGGRELTVVDRFGCQTNFFFAEVDADAVRRIEAKLDEPGASILLHAGQQETAYWNPAAMTDAAGKATVELTIPDRTAAWKLLAFGVTQASQSGGAESELITRKELFGELRLPPAFTVGDTATIPVTVHNAAIAKGQIEVILKTTIGGKTVEEKKSLKVTDRGMLETQFEIKLERPADGAAVGAEFMAGFVLEVRSGDERDVLRRSIPVQPAGLKVFATSSGSAASDATAWIDSPTGMELLAPKLEVLIGPSVERSLLEILLGAPVPCQIEISSTSSSVETTTSDLLTALALQRMIDAARAGESPDAEALDQRIRAAIGLLVSSQKDDGGWGWSTDSAPADRYLSARAAWTLAVARKAGYTVPDDCYERAFNFVASQLVETPESDYETKAVLLHALSTAGRADFAVANRLYRSRPALSNGALAYLALTFAEMDRLETAKELAALLATKDLDDATLRRPSGAGAVSWNQSPVELRALFALVLEKANPADAKLKELIDWLMAHRVGHRWAPDKATGPAASAVCDWYAKSRFQGEHYQLKLVINDAHEMSVEVKDDSGSLVLPVPDKALRKGKNKVRFQLVGRGRYTYQCVLSGFVPSDKLAATTKAWTVRRNYSPAPRELAGQVIPRGFDVLSGSYSAFQNPLTQLPVGVRGHVRLEVYRQQIPNNTPNSQLEYLVITEPIPSGTNIVETTLRGGFERFEIMPGAITFYVGSRRYVEPIEYELHGYVSGSYRAGPTVVRNAYRPDEIAIATPKELTVLPFGAASADEYRLTPRELFEFGRRHFESKNWAAAGQHLAELIDKWTLNPDIYRQTVQMLLDIHLQVGPPEQVVRYFEIVKERWPNEELSFDEIMKVGAAYHEMNEYERSYHVFRATVEASFLRESGVAGFLESQGEFVRSVDVMSRMLLEYPPEPYNATAQYALAQRVYAYANRVPSDTRLRERKITPFDVVRHALIMLENFMVAYPEDPAADQAAFSVANALLELKAYRQAIAACTRFAKLYPESDFIDSFWYIVGYGHFALGEHEAALEMCRKVAESKREDTTTGRSAVDSSNKWQAIYILGQVYHSLGKASEAIAEYTRVEDRFPDAKEAIKYFARQAISLPEVTTVKPTEKVEVPLSFRNVAKCDLMVYRIDLMKFSLLKRNLGGITQINLAGIRPYHEAAIELGDGKDYRDRERTIALPLKEEGAYLVVCRGDDLHATGLVLVTPLAIEVQEDATSGQVRATIKDLPSDQFLPRVHIKVIGSQNPDFTSGETDLRGVFVAGAIRGTSTVIAQLEGDRYAFYRGKTPLGPQAEPSKAEPSAAAADAPANQPPMEGGELLEQLKKSNERLQHEQDDNLRRNYYDQKPQGVPAKAAL